MPTPAWNPGTAAVLFILEQVIPGLHAVKST